MNIIVKRTIFNGNNTLGRMYIDGVFFAYTLEDTYIKINKLTDKVPGQTAIPYGSYKVVVTNSMRFKRELPELLNVPYFTAIRIHGGNTEADTHGCILIGANTNEKTIWNCGTKVNEITNMIKNAKGDVTITIMEEFQRGTA